MDYVEESIYVMLLLSVGFILMFYFCLFFHTVEIFDREKRGSVCKLIRPTQCPPVAPLPDGPDF